MKINLTISEGVRVEITKGSMYGYKLTIFKPTQSAKAKNSHSASDLFFPTTQALSKHLYFLGLEGDSFESLMDNQSKFNANISSQLSAIFSKGAVA
jgi:hypothetical protein